jgi:hypothetical protein
MMKAVMRELAQARRHYAKLPLFEFLRDDSIAARDRLAFYPCMAPFVLALSDVYRFVLRDETTDDPHQKLVNGRTYADEYHWSRYLEDLAKLGFDRGASVTHVLRAQMKDDVRESRLSGMRLSQFLHRTTPLEKLVALEALEQTADVLFEATAKIAAEIEAGGGPALHYLGPLNHAPEPHRPPRGYDHGAFAVISLTSLERMRCLDLSFRVFDLFADWSAELLAYARNSLAHRASPHLVHPKPGVADRIVKRL